MSPSCRQTREHARVAHLADPVELRRDLVVPLLVGQGGDRRRSGPGADPARRLWIRFA
jgi:hypothetical protein